MKKNLATAICGLLSLVLQSSALAQREPLRFYVGGSASSINARQYCEGVTINCDHTASALKIFGGYQITRQIGVEIGYTQTGKLSTNGTVSGVPTNTTTKMRAWDFVGVGTLPLTGRVSAYGKLGFYVPTTETSSNSGGTISTSTNTRSNWTVGGGAAADLTGNLVFRAEWQRYSQVGGGTIASGPVKQTDVDFLGVGLLYRF